MTCACGNPARYVASTGALTCAICPLKQGLDSIRIADIPALLAWARLHLAEHPEHPWYAMDRDLRSIVGKDVSK